MGNFTKYTNLDNLRNDLLNINKSHIISLQESEGKYIGFKSDDYLHIYKEDGSEILETNKVSASLQISAAGVSTFCAPFDVKIPDTITIKKLEFINGSLNITIVEDHVLKAGTAVVLEGPEINITLTEIPKISQTICMTGCLVGNLGEVKEVAPTGKNYLLQKQSYGIAWYKVSNSGLKVGQNRCYLTTDSNNSIFTIN